MDEKEKQKRINYFDLKRDDFMALEEYLLSGLSDRDLGKAGGGMMNINDMTRPVGYEDGGNVITRRLASARAEKSFEDFLKDAGFTKKDEVTGKLRGAKGNWAKYLNSKNIKVGSVEATDELNRILKAAGKPRYVDVKMAGKETIEDLISVVTDTEPGKRKKDVNVAEERNNASKKIKDLKTQANKLHGANPSKAKNAFFKEALERMWPILKNTARGAAVLSATLAKGALGKALGPLDLLITTEMGSGELTPETIEEYKKGQAQERMNKRGGGMANINTMTAPLGYKDAGEVGPREDIIQKTNEMITYLNARVAEQSFGTEPAARIINDITEERRKENPDYDRLNKMYLEYSGMDDFASKVYFTDKHETEKKGRSEKGFLSRILNTIHDVTMRPKDAEIGYNAGGLASISQMTRPVHMEGGGDASLKNLLNQLRLQLMLEKGIEESILMPSGNPDKIKRLEERIRQIEIEIGE